MEEYNLETLQFDGGGIGAGETFFGVTHPIIGLDARSISEVAKNKTEELFPTSSRHNDKADAFRHAYASFLLTKSQGAWAAKRVGDAHEVSVPNVLSERTMDLYNNYVGRALASNPFNWGRDPVQVVMSALNHGLLITHPLGIAPDPTSSY